MRRTATILTILTVASTYVVSSAEASVFRTSGPAQEPRPLMELSETSWEKDLVVAPADADLIDLLEAVLNVPIPTQATSQGHLRGNINIQSYDPFNRREPQEGYARDGRQPSTGSPTGSPTESPTASPTSYFSPSIDHDIKEGYYTGTPTASPTRAPSSPTATIPAALTPTASPTRAPSSAAATFSATLTPAASPTLAPSSPTVRSLTGTAEGFESDSPTSAPTSAPDAGGEVNGARAAMTMALVGVDVSTIVATLAISIAIVATTIGAEAFLFF